jgi:hypothetical protein
MRGFTCFWHDRYSFRMNCAQIRIFKQRHQIRLRRLYQID